MTTERKKIIYEFYTKLYQFHLKYCDIDNLSPDAEGLWDEYINQEGETLIEHLKELGGETDDYKAFRQMLAKQFAIFEQQSKERAIKKMQEGEEDHEPVETVPFLRSA